MRALIIFAVAFMVVSIQGEKQYSNAPCVKWVSVCGSDPLPSNIIIVGNQATRFGSGATWQELSCVPKNNASTPFGHRDYPDNNAPWSEYCWYSATGNEPPPSSGGVPPHDKCSAVATTVPGYTLSWALSQSGSSVPFNAVVSLDGSTAMARSLSSNTNYGNVIPGYALVNGGVLGGMYFDDFGGNIASDYEVAVCNGTTPPPTQTPQPTAPVNNSIPYIRFGHTVPTAEAVDCVITQGSITYSWNNYQFGHFSSWVQLFQVGTGTIDIYHNVNGQRLGKLVSVQRLLTPGPLVVVIKDYWPVSVDSNVETIAASYPPMPVGKSGVRLFNLSPDTRTAGLKQNGVQIVPNGIVYTLGSDWVPVAETSATFSVFSESGSSLGNVTTTPPSGGAVFTVFFIGVQNGTYPQGLQTQVVSLIDAPE